MADEEAELEGISSTAEPIDNSMQDVELAGLEEEDGQTSAQTKAEALSATQIDALPTTEMQLLTSETNAYNSEYAQYLDAYGPTTCSSNTVLQAGGFAGGSCSGTWQFKCPCGYFPMHLDIDSSADLLHGGWSQDCTKEIIHFYCCNRGCKHCYDPTAKAAAGTGINEVRHLATVCKDTEDGTTTYSCTIEPSGFVSRVINGVGHALSHLEADEQPPSSSAMTTAAAAATGTVAFVGVAGFAAVAMMYRKIAQKDADANALQTSLMQPELLSSL